MMQVSISIIIPHLNQPQFLERCLNALKKQVEAHRDVEVIVVDNGSKQTPYEICSRYPFAQVARESEPGPGPARNHGIALSQGEILAFIDADCVADENWLSALRNFFEANPNNQVVGGDVRIGHADPEALTALEAYESVFAYRQKEYIEKHRFSGTGNLAMRRKAYVMVGPFVGIAIAEDRDWGRRAFEKNIEIKYVEGMIVYHPARLTFKELTRKWDRHIDHDFNELGAGLGSKLKWLALTAAVAASGIIDIRKIISSPRLSGLGNKLRASSTLLRIRVYRAYYMFRLVFTKQGINNPKWNQ
jgi:glycosyltransferase involved in cell wall biosynthesis